MNSVGIILLMYFADYFTSNIISYLRSYP